MVGWVLGDEVGKIDGCDDGATVGCPEGFVDGEDDGCEVGHVVG